MDRHAPDVLLDDNQKLIKQSEKLIEKWHKHKRLNYAFTPRFAATSTEDQLQLIQQLSQQYPDVYLHTHLSENKQELAWVKELFPWANHYLDVYQHYGLVKDNSIFAHGLQSWLFCPFL